MSTSTQCSFSRTTPVSTMLFLSVPTTGATETVRMGGSRWSSERLAGALATTTPTATLSERRRPRIISLGRIPSTPDTSINGSYPMSVALSGVASPNTRPTGRDLIAFIRSPKGQDILRAHGSLPENGEIE